jgi:hypothetical protein
VTPSTRKGSGMNQSRSGRARGLAAAGPSRGAAGCPAGWPCGEGLRPRPSERT